MVFSSTTFLFFFLPIVLLLYHGVSYLPVHLGSQSRIWIKLSNAFLLLACVGADGAKRSGDDVDRFVSG